MMTARQSAPLTDSNTGSILVVDDEIEFAASTAALFREHGYFCEWTADPDRAIAMLEETPFDLVVSDLSFDGTERLDFVEAVRRSQGSPAVVLVTAYPTLESAIGALDLGLAAYLVKPVEFHTMHARAQLLLDWRASIQRTRLTLEQLNAALPQMADLGTRVATGAAPTRLPEEKLSEAGLTRRETELVAALLEGYRVSTVARRLGISENTVRRHLKSIFLKLEVRSQAELLEKLKP